MSCYGLRSDPNEITVELSVSDRNTYKEPIKVVKIVDPDGHTYALPPDRARGMADRIEKNNPSVGCISLAEDIRAIAKKIEDG